MNFTSTYNLIDSVAVFLLLLLSLFLLRLDTGRKLSHRLLAAFFLCLALSYMDGVFIEFNYYFHHTYAHMIYVTMSFDFLVGPLLYLYILSRTQIDFQLRPRHLWLGVPFILHFAFIFANYHIKSLEEKRALLAGGQVFSHGEVYALTVISNFHYALYMALVLYTLRVYQNTIKDNYSDIHRVNLNWLFLICCGLMLGGAMRLMNNLLWLEVPQSRFHQHIDLKLVAISSVLAFAATIVYKCLQQPNIIRADVPPPLRFPALHLAPFASEPHTDKPVKYKTTPLSPTARAELAKKLDAYMQSQKPFLNAELTLAELARSLAIPSHHLSQVINGEFAQNFYDYVNSYRVRESAERLSTPALRDIYITQIMYDCGFNSKSVFNTVFKKTLGTTPSNYRKQLSA